MVNLVFIWSIIGYQFLALLTTALSLPGSELSLMMRTLVAGAALYCIGRFIRIYDTAYQLAFTVFWLAYFSRFAVSMFIHEDVTTHAYSYYWIWSIGASFLPALAVLNGGHAMRQDMSSVIFWMAMVVCILSWKFGSFGMENEHGSISNADRLTITNLNSISLGHVGTTLFLLGFWRIIEFRKCPQALMVALVGIGMGLATLFMANSRGPIAALAVAVLIFFAARRRSKQTFIVYAVMSLGAVFVFVSSERAMDLAATAGSRFALLGSGNDLSANIRIGAYEGSLLQFFGSPLFGDGIEEKTTGYYPHNFVLEAFMALGAFGGAIFLFLLFGTARKAFRLMKTDQAWIGLLFIQAAVSGMFSGALYASYSFWVLMAFVIVKDVSVSRSMQKKQLAVQRTASSFSA